MNTINRNNNNYTTNKIIKVNTQLSRNEINIILLQREN